MSPLRHLPLPRPVGLGWTFLFSYVLGFALLAALIWVSGIWDFLANTRLLDLLIDGGVVALRDDQPGFVLGVPDLGYYLKSQDPIDWPLVGVAIGVFCTFWWIKALQHHGLARFVGLSGSFGQHARAYLYGNAMHRILPYDAGGVAMASAFAGSAGSLDAAAVLIFLGKISVVLALLVYSLGALYDIGWGLWLAQLFWPLVILGGAWFFVRRSAAFPRTGVLQGTWQDWKDALRALAQQPRVAARVAILGLVAFGLEDIAAFVIAMAFTGNHVIIDVPFGVLLMGVVGGYVARLIPVTPGGIGQFEWGFALALYWGGLGLPECVALAVLDNLIRYCTGAALAGAVVIGRGVETDWEKVRAVFTRVEADPG
ncbi:MAG TPA: YbhN family protein [Kofleriaceae bacterium]|nr:YbhN family protein [Kofleriaceae bacterium]